MADPFLSPSEAARQLGVSTKALRLYEQRGLLVPSRTAARWRVYGPADMARARDIVALRALGLSLAEVQQVVLSGKAESLRPALVRHQHVLQHQVRAIVARLTQVRALCHQLDEARILSAGGRMQGAQPTCVPDVVFDLPWPWDGERFELRDVSRLNFLVGPLFSGKTRLARAIAAHWPGCQFLGLERAMPPPDDDAHAARIEAHMAWLAQNGARPSPALGTLVTALSAAGPRALVVDMVEQGLDAPSQEALMALLRRGDGPACPMFLMTRSNAILDLTAADPSERIIFCPANHGPPRWVLPVPGAEGYDAVATCLASPAVRARSEGVVAMRIAL